MANGDNYIIFCQRYSCLSSVNVHCIIKGIYNCLIEIIKGLTGKGQFQYLTKLKGPIVGNYLYTTHFLSER